MDCLFNLQIPKSTEKIYIIKPYGKTFITGVAKAYSPRYDPKILADYISPDDFSYMITYFNEVLFTYWPCCTCFSIGYIFCACTCGLSFLLPNNCIADAE